MITPNFSVSQTDNQITITINAPYTNIKDTEIHVHEDDVRFHSAPYYLRLSLPGKVIETDNSSAKYYEETRSYEVILDKVTPGEHFEGLDRLTKMLQPHSSKKVVATKPLIEVLSDDPNMDQDSDVSCNCEFDEEDWFCEQTLPEFSAISELLQQYTYGFANGHKGLKDDYEAELGEAALIKNPDNMSPLERRKQRIEEEKSNFSDDHYLSDLMQNDDIKDILAAKVNLNKFTKLTDIQKEKLKNFPNREFIMDKLWQKRVCLGLYDIMFAYIYDAKITRGSHCVESQWNISRISSTLCWFEIFDTVEEVLHSCVRRSLVYPYYRHWDLSIACARETILLFKKGITALLKCLLDIHALFRKTKPYYILNQLYIEEYCVWIQTKIHNDFETMTDALEKAIKNLSKDSMDLDLVELEAAGRAVEDEEMEDAISSQISRVAI